MERKNPRAGQGARAGMSIAADTPSHSRHRPKIQANAAMRQRLSLLIGLPEFGRFRHAPRA